MKNKITDAVMRLVAKEITRCAIDSLLCLDPCHDKYDTCKTCPKTLDKKEG